MFKYLRFDEWSLSNLISNNLYLNHYSSFNDPFECRCEIRAGFPQLADSSARLADVMRAWGFERPDDEVAVENYEDYISSLEGAEPNIAYYIDSARITCFSKRPDNLLMWSHYGDGLRGFCIEFDKEIIASLNHDANIYNVAYADSPSVVDTSVMAVLNDQWHFNNDAFFETEAMAKHTGKDRSFELSLYEADIKAAYEQIHEVFQKMLATKPMAWSYEEELRLIEFSKQAGRLGVTMRYPDSAIKSVILGEKISQVHEQTIFDILTQKKIPHARLKRAIRIDGSFDVHIIDL